MLVFVLVAFIATHRHPPTDIELIQTQINGAEQAAQNRDIGALMPYISTHYHDASGLNKEALYFLMTHSLNRDNGPFQMSLSQPNITVSGDTATSVFQLTVTSSGGTFDHAVTLQWQREEGTSILDSADQGLACGRRRLRIATEHRVEDKGLT